MKPPDPEFLALVEEFESRSLSPDEFRARTQVPISAHEHEDLESMVSWFTRRYPTAGERLRASRHLTAQWLRNRPR